MVTLRLRYNYTLLKVKELKGEKRLLHGHISSRELRPVARGGGRSSSTDNPCHLQILHPLQHELRHEEFMARLLQGTQGLRVSDRDTGLVSDLESGSPDHDQLGQSPESEGEGGGESDKSHVGCVNVPKSLLKGVWP